MTSMNTTTTFSGPGNQGSQVGSNSGQIHNHFNIHCQPKPSPTKPNPSSTVPFRRDPDFIDRDILVKVDLKSSKPASRTALVGLGGVGKSQLAIEFAYRIRDRFPQTVWVFWVHASNVARFREGYETIASRVKIRHQDEPTTDILQLVSNWLSDETNGRWIMILDNADDSSVFSDPHRRSSKYDIGDLVGDTVTLSDFLPQTPNGSILVTSRSKDTALLLIGNRHDDIIKVEPMDEDHALLLLGKKLQGGFDRGDAIELLRALDYMPLAISQAAAYINRGAPRITLATYLNDFRKSDMNRANLLSRSPKELGRDSNASNSIVTTWHLSFKCIRKERPSAARLLSLMSFFDRQGIPESLLRCSDDRGDISDIKTNAKADMNLENDSDVEFGDDVFTLTSYSLISTNVESGQFEMHRLVQFSTRKWLEENKELEKWKRIYIRIISDAFPSGDYENWTVCRGLFPHAEAVLSYRPVEKKDLVYWSAILNRAGCYAGTQGNDLSAEEMNRRALEGREEALGEKHPNTLTSVSDLALVLQYQGKYEAAQEMNRRALDGREQVLGKKHPDTLTSVSNLALLLQLQGKYEAAEEMSRRALDGREKTLGKEHPNTLTSVNNLALALRYQGKYEEAEEMNRRALEEREKVLGKEHPDTLTSVSSLALVLRFQGNYEAAEEMNRRALDGREKTLRKEHPDTLTSVNDLATVLQYQGKYEAAAKMNRRALDGYEKALGKEHPHTLTSVSNLALVLRYERKYEAAEEMNRRALDGREKALGKEHPVTLTSVSILAGVLRYQEKYEAAEEMNRRALDGREKVLGKEHPDTLTSVSNLALVLQLQGKYKAAEEMSRRALDGSEKALGKEHPDTLTSVYCLAYLLHQQRQYNEATTLYERSYAGLQKTLGINHPTSIACSRRYSSLIEEMKDSHGSSIHSKRARTASGSELTTSPPLKQRRGSRSVTEMDRHE